MRPKSIKYIALAIAFAVFLLFSTFQVVSAGSELDPAENQGATAPPLSSAKSGLAAPLPQAGGATTATLQAASGATIAFHPNNNPDPNVAVPIPHFILHENSGLTTVISRTLLVTVSDIEVPLSGVTVTLEIKTQHEDPDQGGAPAGAPQIPVWDESRWISNTWGVTRTDIITTFAVEFDHTVLSGTTAISTPTDYFQYAILVGGVPPFNPVEHAFLMENRVRTDLGDGENDLLVRYYDMAPFGHKDNWGGAPGAHWLRRKEVSDQFYFFQRPHYLSVIQ